MQVFAVLRHRAVMSCLREAARQHRFHVPHKDVPHGIKGLGCHVLLAQHCEHMNVLHPIVLIIMCSNLSGEAVRKGIIQAHQGVLLAMLANYILNTITVERHGYCF